MRQAWIAVASADHVQNGITQGIMQVCHGKAAPLRRVQPGDFIAYYSPKITFSGHDKLQAFTAIGVVKDKAPYQFDGGHGFQPFRRDVNWLPAQPAHIQNGAISFALAYFLLQNLIFC